MDKLTILNERKTQVLECMARYTYLTVNHLVDLGIAPQARNVRDRYLRPLTEGRSPLVGSGVFHVSNKPLPWVYYLTKRGAEVVAELWNVPVDEVYYPVGKIQFTRDYQHRVETIDCMIAFEQWAEQNDAEINFWHTYFQVEGSQRKANQQLIRKTQVTLGGETIVPDLNLGILTQNTSRLFTLELHRQPKTQRIVQQLAKHADILRNEVLSEKYNHPHLHYVLSVHHSEQSMKLVQKELRRSDHCEHVEECFLFTHYQSLTSEFRNAWTNLTGLKTNLFYPSKSIP